MSADSDVMLAQRVVTHDRAAFSLLYDRYAASVFAVAAHMLGRERADGIVQDVFLRLWNHADQFDPARGSFRAWFMSVARNHMRDQLRRQKTRERVIQVAEIEKLIEVATPHSDTLNKVAMNERKALLLRALQTLPEVQRQVILLAYFGGLTHKAISEQLDWPLGTVKKRISLGLSKLRHQLLAEDQMLLLSDFNEGHD